MCVAAVSRWRGLALVLGAVRSSGDLHVGFQMAQVTSAESRFLSRWINPFCHRSISSHSMHCPGIGASLGGAIEVEEQISDQLLEAPPNLPAHSSGHNAHHLPERRSPLPSSLPTDRPCPPRRGAPARCPRAWCRCRCARSTAVTRSPRSRGAGSSRRQASQPPPEPRHRPPGAN